MTNEVGMSPGLTGELKFLNWRGLMLTVASLAVAGWAQNAQAQTFPPGYVDPAPVLQQATEAIGADRIRCLTATGDMRGGRVGQEKYIRPEGDWPMDKLSNFVRTMNWDDGTMRDAFDRTPGLTPSSFKYGIGWTDGTPTQVNTRQTFAVKDGVAWHSDGVDAPAQPIAPEIAAFWQLELWLNPVGFLKAAAMPGADPIAAWRWELGETGRDGPTTIPERVTVVSIKVLGKYRVDATINDRHLIQRIHTRYAHPVLGDLNVEHEFTDEQYVTIGEGMKFPSRWHHHQGYDDNYNTQTISSGHNALDGPLANMVVNQCGAPITRPVNLARPADPTRIDTLKLADGVSLIGGASHNSVAIEFKDYVAVVEAPINEARSLAVINEVTRLYPGKPIRYLINTHQHFDHIGGIRTYAHIGATIITHARNHAFYNRDVVNYTPRQMDPDLMTLMPPTEVTEGYNYELVRENYTLSDGQRLVRINYVQPLDHADGMLMVYLPREKLLIEADLVDTHEKLRAGGDAGTKRLAIMVKTLGYDVGQIAPIHGPPVSWKAFLAATGGAQ